MEILKERNGRALDIVFCCCGGGGLVAGVAAYIKQVRPEVKVGVSLPHVRVVGVVGVVVAMVVVVVGVSVVVAALVIAVAVLWLWWLWWWLWWRLPLMPMPNEGLVSLVPPRLAIWSLPSRACFSASDLCSPGLIGWLAHRPFAIVS